MSASIPKRFGPRECAEVAWHQNDGVVDRDVGGGDLYEGIVCVGRYDHQDEIGECEGLFHVGGQVMNFCESLFFDADEIDFVRSANGIERVLEGRNFPQGDAMPLMGQIRGDRKGGVSTTEDGDVGHWENLTGNCENMK